MDSGNTVAYILGGEEACDIEHLFVAIAYPCLFICLANYLRAQIC
jgi:hypothetical protein